jgi:hypothetical protein
MKQITFKSFAIALCFAAGWQASAQQKPNANKQPFTRTVSKINPNNGLERCAFDRYEEYLREANPERLNSAAFERWIAPKIEEAKAAKAASGDRSTSIVINVPVVVHVIHNGDAVGANENIADSRINSQITVLNQDFRRMTGTPGFNTNPVGADVEIQFCLARTNPDGGATTGINRVNLGVASWSTWNSVEGTLKPQTQWDPSRYFNIWVCQFSSNQNAQLYGILGYAQFPTASGLSGLSSDGGFANTDGVIIDYRCFGSKTLANVGTYFPDYDKGRTATHEVGHCFGLLHIWGDSNLCAVDDFCADTPQASTEHYGCDVGADSCPQDPGLDMVQNYMDYSDDVCMNIFTQNQKERMLAVMQNSPRRASLATSQACNVAQVYQNDGSLNLTNLNIAGCNVSFAPTLTLRNMGTATLTNATISYNIDGAAPASFNWTGSLATNAIANVTMPSVTSTPGNHMLNISIATVNGQPDPLEFNSTKSIPFTLAAKFNTTQVLFTLQQDVYGSETTWNLKNSAGTTVYSGGPYTDTNSTLPPVINQTWNIANNECYTFTINDLYGDGICCDYGAGYYTLKTSGGITMISGGEFGVTEVKRFGIDQSLSTAAYNALQAIVLYPNPATDVINIGADAANMPEQYSVYNAIGQVVAKRSIGNVADLSISTSAFTTGVYFVKLTKDGESKTLQFVKK